MERACKRKLPLLLSTILMLSLLLSMNGVSVLAETLAVKEAAASKTQYLTGSGNTIAPGDKNTYFRVVQGDKTVWPADNGKNVEVNGHKYSTASYSPASPGEGFVWKVTMTKVAGDEINLDGSTKIPYKVTLAKVAASEMAGKAAEVTEVPEKAKAERAEEKRSEAEKSETEKPEAEKSEAGKPATEKAEAVQEAPIETPPLAKAEKLHFVMQPKSNSYDQAATPELLKADAQKEDGSSDGIIFEWFMNTTGQAQDGASVGKGGTYLPDTKELGIKYFYCVARYENSDGSISEAISDLAKIEVKEIPAPEAKEDSALRFIQNPQYASYKKDEPAAALTAEAVREPSGSSDGISYQWYRRDIDSTGSEEAVAGQTAISFTPPTNLVGKIYYYCKASYKAPSGQELSAASEMAAIEVSEKEEEPAETLDFTVQPKGGSYQQNAPATALTAKAVRRPSGSSDGISYQWYKSLNKSREDAAPIEGAVSEDYKPETSREGTSYYFCMASFKPEGEAAVTAVSKLAEIQVVKAPVDKITVKVAPEKIECKVGDRDKAFTAKARSGLNKSYKWSYQWEWSDSDSPSGQWAKIEKAYGRKESYTVPTAKAKTRYYRCLVTTDKGQKATSNIVKLVVKDKASPKASLAITSHPKSAAYNLREKAKVLTVSYTRTGPGKGEVSYQWYQYSANKESGNAIAGANKASYTPPTNKSGTTYYYVVIKDASTKLEARSNDAKIYVRAASANKNNIRNKLKSKLSTSRSKNAKTGDNSHILLWGGGILLALGVLLTLLIKKRREK